MEVLYEPAHAIHALVADGSHISVPRRFVLHRKRGVPTMFRITRTHEMVVKRHSRNLGIFLLFCLQALSSVRRLVARTSDTVGTPVPVR